MKNQRKINHFSFCTFAALMIALISTASLNAQITFTDINAGLTGVDWCDIAWGDYDNDGDLDLVLMGEIDGGNPGANGGYIYRNDNGSFTDIHADLVGVEKCALSWGDYDNDGDLDLVYAGGILGVPHTYLYRNDGNDLFTLVETNLPDVHIGDLSWGDYDNDGDLDLIITGTSNQNSPLTKIYKNDSGNFTDIAANIVQLGEFSSVSWADYDNDGDLDFVITGRDNNSKKKSIIYRNDNNSFTDIQANLFPLAGGPVAWGDYNNNGELDLFIVGEGESSKRYFKIYNNHNSIFSEISTNINGIVGNALSLGDYDNDGDLDIAISGSPTNWQSYLNKIYKNDGNGNFVEFALGFPGLDMHSSTSWGDYDNDGDLDIVMAGRLSPWGSIISRIYQNDGGNSNNWLSVIIKGNPNDHVNPVNIDGIGVRLKINYNNQWRQISTDNGCVVRQAHFGLGTVTVVDSIIVNWGDSSTDILTDVAANQVLKIIQGETAQDTILSCKFFGDPLSGTAPLEVLFSDLSTPPDSITSWNWNFGDGSTSELQNPTHTYTEIGLYDVSLSINKGTINEITKVKDGYIHVYKTNLDSGLVAYYPFNSNANDESGNENHGINYGATLTNDRFGNVNSAYHFDGDNDWIEIQDNNSLDIDDGITISMWINSDVVRDQMILGKSNYLTATNYLIRLGENGNIQWEYDQYFTTASNLIDSGKWYHIVVTASGQFGTKNVYLNGITVLESSGYVHSTFGTVNNSLSIGGATYGREKYSGILDDIRIYNRSLNEDEIKALFQEGLSNTGTIAGIVTDATTGIPILGATVSVADSLSTTTNQSGEFELLNVPSGLVRVKAYKIGYDTTRITVNLQPGETKNLNLILTKKEIIENSNWVTVGHDYQRTSYSNTMIPDSLNIRLKIPIEAASGFNNSPVVVNDTIYAGGIGNTIKAIKITGEEIWSYTNINHLSSADIWQDYLVTSTKGKVLVLNRHTGALIRSISHTGVDNNDVAAIYNGIAYKSYVGSGVFAADITTGNILWDKSTGGYCCNSPTVTKDGTKVLADNASNGEYYCFEAGTGNLLWKYSSGVSWGSGQPTVENDRVYFSVGSTGTPSDLICLDLNTGTEIWRVDILPDTRHPSRIAVHNGKIYFGSEEAHDLFCYDTDGNKIWTVPLGAAAWCPVISANNKVILPARNGNLYQVDTQTGSILQTHSLGFKSYSWSFTLYNQEWYGYLQYNDNWYLTVLGEDKYTGLIDAVFNIPAGFQLHQNYPNPFNPSTTIQFAVSHESYVEIKILDILGREIRTLISKKMTAGWHKIIWDGKEDNGTSVTSGIYIYKIFAGDFVSFRKMILLK